MTFKATMDPRERPAYAPSEAARYLQLPVATLRSWIAGRSYPKAGGRAEWARLIQPPSQRPSILSFSNLVEAHVLRALRTRHGVSVKAVRQAIDYAERELKVKRLLLSPLLLTSGGEILLDRYGSLISLSQSGQLVMRSILERYLERIEWDRTDLPSRLFPLVPSAAEDHRSIVIDPKISFGRPSVARKGISTAAIAGRLLAGEDADDVARDYDLSRQEVDDAAIYELAA